MRKIISLMLIAALSLSLAACSSATEETTEETTQTEAVVETFTTEYEMKGTTSSGKPKNDTFIFNGTTTDGIITELEFDVIRNKGTEGEYSKTDIMGYLMNISDATIEDVDGTLTLTKLSAYGYDPAYAEGAAAQFMVSATASELTDELTFADLTFVNDATGGTDEVAMDKALIAYNALAQEAGAEGITEETLVKDLVALHGLYVDGAYVAGTNRVSFNGIAGGRSYGEQIQAIEDHILASSMTLEDVYEMFKTVNQADEEIASRDAIAGATITFVGDFQRMAYVAIHGEIFEGVTTHTENEDGTITAEVVTQGFGGEIETKVTFDADKVITMIEVRDHTETEGYGADILVDGSDYLASLVANGAETEIVAGATVTSNALTKAVTLATEYVNAL